MADTRKEYTAIFSIGGRLLGSFKGAMGQAQARMSRLQRSATAMMAGLRRSAMLASAAFGLIFGAGLIAGGAMLRKIFQSAGAEMQEAQDRARLLTASFMRNEEIRKKGIGRAQELVGLFQQQTEQIYKQGILSQDMLDNMVVQMARAKIPPAAIRDALEPMADLLAVTKGVKVTEEDATQMAFAWGKAINTGMVRPLQKFGIFLGPEQQKAFREMVKVGNIKGAHQYLVKIAKQFKGWNKKTLEAPGAAVVKFNQELEEMSERIGAHILPMQDKMARAWLRALPRIEPALIWAMQKLGDVVGWVTKQATDMIDVFSTPPAREAWKDFSNAFKGLAQALGMSKVDADNLGKTLADFLINQIKLMTKEVNDLAGAIRTLKWQWSTLKFAFDAWAEQTAPKLGYWLGTLCEKLERFVRLLKRAKALMPFIGHMVPGLGPFFPLGGGGYRGGGGAAAGAGAAAASAYFPPGSPSADLAAQRKRLIGELGNPQIAEAFYSLVKQEVGSQGAAAQQGFMESVFNRASARNQSLAQTITDAAYFPAVSLRKVAVLEQEMAGYKRLLDDITAGSNVSNYATGNASGRVGFAGGPQTFAAGGERFGVEGPDMAWARAARANAPPPLLAAPYQAGGIVRGLTRAWLGERGPEAVIPLSGGRRALSLLNYAARSLGVMSGGGGTTVSFAPNITINGNATESEQRAMDTRLRDLARDFIRQFTAAQYQERRLSYQGGYG